MEEEGTGMEEKGAGMEGEGAGMEGEGTGMEWEGTGMERKALGWRGKVLGWRRKVLEWRGKALEWRRKALGWGGKHWDGGGRCWDGGEAREEGQVVPGSRAGFLRSRAGAPGCACQSEGRARPPELNLLLTKGGCCPEGLASILFGHRHQLGSAGPCPRVLSLVGAAPSSLLEASQLRQAKHQQGNSSRMRDQLGGVQERSCLLLFPSAARNNTVLFVTDKL